MNEQPRSVDSLRPADYNPRTISKHDAAALDASIGSFGDLSSIVFNTTTGQLVGGHQRIKSLMKRPDVSIEYIKQFPADALGTVGLGFVVVAGTAIRLPYREVSWPLEVEQAANVAANRIQGQFVLPALNDLNKKIMAAQNPKLIELTGQRQDEIKSLLKSFEKPTELPPQQEPTPPVSQSGEVYMLGPHRLVAGDTDLQSVDKLREHYADLMHADEWESYTAATSVSRQTPTQPQGPPNAPSTPTI